MGPNLIYSFILLTNPYKQKAQFPQSPTEILERILDSPKSAPDNPEGSHRTAWGHIHVFYYM